MSRPLRKSVAVFAALASLSVSCSGKGGVYPPAPHDGGGGLALAGGSFETDSHTHIADYGTLVVPESRGRADSRTLELPLIRIRSRSSEPREPIFYLAGGPGVSNLKPSYPPDSLLAEHDIVMVGYRGVDGSTVLHCPEGVEAMTRDGSPLLSEKRLRAIGAGWAACGRRLEQSGIDLRSYTMMDVIEDLEVARRELGYERVNLLSRSYGTRVAYLYGLRYPEHIVRSLMIGANPPGRFIWEPDIAERQLQYYAELWSRDAQAVSRSPDLLQTMRSVVDHLPSRWLLFDIDPGKVEVMTLSLLFFRSTAPYVFDAYIAAQTGDASGLALMSMAFNYMMPPAVVWGDLTAKGISADFEPQRDYFNEMDPPGAIFGSPLGKFCWASMQFGEWPYDPIPEEYRRPRPSAVETLVINGSIDFSTPAENTANELMPYLERGKHVVLSEAGHVNDLLSFQPRARDHLVAGFFASGVADDSRYTYEPMDFEVGFSLGLVAKVLVAVVCAGVFGGSVVVVWTVRHIGAKRIARTPNNTDDDGE